MVKENYQELQIKNIPPQLLKQFDAEVVPDFPGGRNEAIRTLMRDAIQKKRRVAALGE